MQAIVQQRSRDLIWLDSEDRRSEAPGKTITEVNEIAATIAAAVEEQGTATQDIARTVQEAARGPQLVTDNITGVSTGAEETGKSAASVRESAGQLSQQSEALRAAVDKFLADIKAA